MNPAPALLALLLAPATASACDCLRGPQPACAELWNYQSGAVFSGTVSQITEPAPRSESFPRRTVLLSVERVYAGVRIKQIAIRTGRGGGDCGYPFEVGHRYLVYALHRLEDNELEANVCSPTKNLEDASEDLAYLDRLERLPKSSRIFGVVADPWKDRANGFPRTSVELIGASGAQKTLTDAHGKFDVSGLTPGRYRIHTAVPGYILGDAEVEVHARGCAQVQLWLGVDGRISGRILDSEGRGVQRI